MNTFESINNILETSFFIKKASGKYGIRGTTKFDNSEAHVALYNATIETEFSLNKYKSLVQLGYLPKFHIGDLVSTDTSKAQISEIKQFAINASGNFIYKTTQPSKMNEVQSLEESTLVQYGTSAKAIFPTLGKEKDLMSEVHAVRLSHIFQTECIDKINVPKEHNFDDLKGSSNWFGGFACGNISTHLRYENSFANTSYLKQLGGEIRLHLKQRDQLSATLWLKHGNQYFGKYKDLFDSNTKERYIYADDYENLFKKIVEV